MMREPTDTGSTNAAATQSRPAEHDATGIQKIKVKLVGEMGLANDAPGFDPYNSAGGKTAQIPWRRREDRR
ncbi:MAG: hypothetical protein KDI32_02420 [Pseudomonadales bacterium]|nr:hypothetical protein [Pseudomonadales bacterium]